MSHWRSVDVKYDIHGRYSRCLPYVVIALLALGLLGVIISVCHDFL